VDALQSSSLPRGFLGMHRHLTTPRLAELPPASSTPRGRRQKFGAVLVLLVVWLLLHLRVSAPINRALTAASDKHDIPSNAHALQRD